MGRGRLEKHRQIQGWIRVGQGCRRQGPVAPRASRPGTGGAGGASWHWFVEEGSISGGNPRRGCESPCWRLQRSRDAKHEGQDWANASGSRADKILTKCARGCHRAASAADTAREPSLCPRCHGAEPSPLPSPAPSPAAPAGILRARPRAGLGSPAGRGVGAVGGGLPLEGPGQHCPARS